MVWDNLGVKKNTKNRLKELKLEKQKKRGDEVSYDDVINDLIGDKKASSRNKEKKKSSLEDVFMKL